MPRQLPQSLIFSQQAWLKLKYWCYKKPIEIGGFAITADDDPFYVIDIKMVKQKGSSGSIEFDENSVANYIQDEIEKNHRPVRIWVHTHPGNSATPSGVDERQFADDFGNYDYFIMFILARGSETYARLRIQNKLMYLEKVLPVKLDDASIESGDVINPADWDKEYEENVTEKTWGFPKGKAYRFNRVTGKLEECQDESESVYGNYNVNNTGGSLYLPDDLPVYPSSANKMTLISDIELHAVAEALYNAHVAGDDTEYIKRYLEYRELMWLEQNTVDNKIAQLSNNTFRVIRPQGLLK